LDKEAGREPPLFLAHCIYTHRNVSSVVYDVGLLPIHISKSKERRKQGLFVNIHADAEVFRKKFRFCPASTYPHNNPLVLG
jgi:hypothetical protein